MGKRRSEKYETRLVQARDAFVGPNVYFTMRKRPQRDACFVLPHLWFSHGKIMFDLNKNASRLHNMRFVENAFAYRRGEKPFSPVKCWFYHEETTVQKVKNAYCADDTQLTLASCRRESISLDQMWISPWENDSSKSKKRVSSTRYANFVKRGKTGQREGKSKKRVSCRRCTAFSPKWARVRCEGWTFIPCSPPRWSPGPPRCVWGVPKASQVVPGISQGSQYVPKMSLSKM